MEPTTTTEIAEVLKKAIETSEQAHIALNAARAKVGVLEQVAREADSLVRVLQELHDGETRSAQEQDELAVS